MNDKSKYILSIVSLMMILTIFTYKISGLTSRESFEQHEFENADPYFDSKEDEDDYWQQKFEDACEERGIPF